MKPDDKIAEIPFEEADYCIFDFETTGISPKTEKVIEIGAVRLKNNKIVDSFSSFINPGRKIPFYITLITGITDTETENAPYFDEVFPKIKEFFGDSVLIAHNINFDFSFLKHECINHAIDIPVNNLICTLRLARKLYPELSSKSLGNIVKYLNIRHRDIHRALGDSTATAKVFMKMFNLLRDKHEIDSLSDLINFSNLSNSKKSFRIIKKILADSLVKMPDSPGVYFFKNAKDEIIYIGKAKSLKSRVNNHFQSTAIKKSKEIIRRASDLNYQITKSELSALLAEAELIKIHKPKMNTMLKKYPKSYFIRLRMSSDFPNVEVSSVFDFDGNDYFGPYPNRDTANNIKDIIDKTFLLRECSEKEFSKKRKCFLSDIGRCFAPCIEPIIKQKYAEELSKVKEFLKGNNQSAADRLLNKMKNLSEEQKFEEAAQVRDIVQSVLNQLNRSSILSEPINSAHVLVVIANHHKNEYLLLLNGKIFLKDYFLDTKNLFDQTLEDYFNNTIQLNQLLKEKDLEKLRITLGWLVKNRNRVSCYYLNNYSSLDSLATCISFVL
jgi:DNA polymerase-3 subunit epsilon